jgi:hypothetical protein
VDRRGFIKGLAMAGCRIAVGGNILGVLDPIHWDAVAQNKSSDPGFNLPVWFQEHRVHAHTRLPLAKMNIPVFFHAGEEFKKMGAKVFVRHFRTLGEGAWWPSKFTVVAEEARHRNIAKEIIDEAHQQGLKIISYYNHFTDKYAAEQHPDWITLNWDGKPYSYIRGLELCFNSPYPDLYLQSALELVDLGVDGFLFDEWHQPKMGCWCQFCRTLFKTETGHDLPKRYDENDPGWNELKDFSNRTIERTFLKWTEGIHGRNRDEVVIISSNTWPALLDRHLTNRLFRIADSVKTEFAIPLRQPTSQDHFRLTPEMKPYDRDIKMALGLTMVRDAAGGRPAHVWVFSLQTEISALYAVAGVMTHGCIANVDVIEDEIPAMKFQKAFALGETVSPYFSQAQPLRWAAVHYSESARDMYPSQPATAVRKVIYPMYAAFGTLLRARLPVGIVTDSQLEDGLLDGYKILFVPSRDGLSTKMASNLTEFKQGGGLVIDQGQDWDWSDETGGAERTAKAFMENIGDETKKAPVQAFGGPHALHVVSFMNKGANQLTVAIANDFTWVPVGKGAKDAPKVPAPPPCRDVRVELRGFNKPVTVFEVISGKTLDPKTSDNVISVSVPDFELMAVVVVKFPL